MQSVWRFLAHDWLRLIVPLCVLAGTFAAGYAVRRLMFSGLRRWGSGFKARIDVIMIRSLSAPLMIWSLMLGLYLAARISDLPARHTRRMGEALLILWIISLTLLASRLAGSLITHYGGAIPGAMPVTTLTRNLAQLFVMIVGALVLLNHFRISITPMLTALGVGGLAVALAMQDTLSNLFGGFYVTVAGQVRLGDYIRLSTGEEGYVRDIAWRSTTIRALGNNLIIVPNAKLAQAIVTNYSLPERNLSVAIRVDVSYDSDPDRVEAALLEEARAAIPGLLAEPAPNVRLIPGFGDSALGFTLNCSVAEFVDQFIVQHELRKRILKRFRSEGIEIPYPARAVYLRNSEELTAPLPRDRRS